MIKFLCIFALVIFAQCGIMNQMYKYTHINTQEAIHFKNFMMEFDSILTEAADIMENYVASGKNGFTLYNFLSMLNELGDNRVCASCKSFMTRMQDFLDSDYFYTMFHPIALDVCIKKIKVEPLLCEQAIATMGHIVIKSVAGRVFNEEKACAHLLMCPKTWENESLKSYIDEVLADKPNIPVPTPTLRSTYQALHVTDLHVDLLYETGANSNCDYFICCRQGSGPAPNASSYTQYWATPDSETCDIPMRTVDQFVQFVNRKFDVEVVVWTGDNIAHDIFYQSPTNQTNQTLLITQTFDQYLVNGDPNVHIYPIQGNHETYPVNVFDYIDNTTSWLTEQLASIWAGWLGQEAHDQLLATGFYSQYDPVKNLRVIAVDTQACNNLNFYLLENPTDPYHQLQFIRENLYTAEANNESVYIIAHIPTADGGCDPSWSTRFGALVERFSHVIRGQFYGHTHSDSFSVHRSFSTNEPVGVEFVAPSLTTRSNRYPSFRIYEVDSDTNIPINYYQYRLNASRWNDNFTGPIEWELFYDFQNQYNTTDMSFTTMDQVADNLLSNATLMDIYLSNMGTGYFPPTPTDEGTTWATYCNAKEGNYIYYMLCLGPQHMSFGNLHSLFTDDDGGEWYTYANSH